MHRGDLLTQNHIVCGGAMTWCKSLPKAGVQHLLGLHRQMVKVRAWQWGAVVGAHGAAQLAAHHWLLELGYPENVGRWEQMQAPVAPCLHLRKSHSPHAGWMMWTDEPDP